MVGGHGWGTVHQHDPPGPARCGFGISLGRENWLHYSHPPKDFIRTQTFEKIPRNSKFQHNFAPLESNLETTKNTSSKRLTFAPLQSVTKARNNEPAKRQTNRIDAAGRVGEEFPDFCLQIH